MTILGDVPIYALRDVGLTITSDNRFEAQNFANFQYLMKSIILVYGCEK